jgi:hypothetical protein
MTHRLDSLFPIDPLTLIAACRRLEAKITLYAPELTPQQCDRMLGELSLADGLLSRITEQIRRTPDWQRRVALPEVDPALAKPGLLEAPARQRWRSLPGMAIRYRPAAQGGFVRSAPRRVPDELPAAHPPAAPGD